MTRTTALRRMAKLLDRLESERAECSKGSIGWNERRRWEEAIRWLIRESNRALEEQL